MLTRRCFVDEELVEGRCIELSGRAFHYLAVVLRLKPGDELVLFNHDCVEVTAKILAVRGKLLQIQLLDLCNSHTESPLSVHLFQAVSRGEKMDWVMQKSTELGVASITPIFTARCGVKITGTRLEKRCAHWQSVVMSACEQSGRCHVPQVNSPLTFMAFLKTISSDMPYFACLPKATDFAHQLATKPTSCGLVIGPEGGFDHEEVALLHAHSIQSMSLGPRILRTETAPIVALALLQSRFGDICS